MKFICVDCSLIADKTCIGTLIWGFTIKDLNLLQALWHKLRRHQVIRAWRSNGWETAFAKEAKKNEES